MRNEQVSPDKKTLEDLIKERDRLNHKLVTASNAVLEPEIKMGIRSYYLLNYSVKWTQYNVPRQTETQLVR